MPGQFINSGTNPFGKLSLVNTSNAGNLDLSIAPPSGFADTIFYGFYNTCNAPDGSFAVTGNAVLFCDCTELTGAGFALLSPGIYQINYGSTYNSFLINGTNVATATGTCVPC